MRATGIIRRIDDLGRIVLPKEIRKSLKIKEGDMLEIYVQENGVIMLEKYEPMDSLSKIADNYAETLAEVTGLTVCISTDSYIMTAFGNSKKEYIKKDLSDEVLNILEERMAWSTKNDNKVEIVINDDKNKYMSEAIFPIIDDGNVIGAVIAFSKEKNMSEEDINMLKLTTSLIVKQME